MNRKVKDVAAEVKAVKEKKILAGESNGALEDLLMMTREVGHALQNRKEGDSLDYNKLAKLLSEFSTTNVYILAKDGEILGYAWVPDYKSQTFSNFIKDGYMPEEFVEKINRCRESEINEDDADLFDDEKASTAKSLMYAPIYGAAAERLGTIVSVRFEELFTTRDVLLAEYVGNLVGIEILNGKNRDVEEQSRDRVSVQMAMRALSYSEVESMKHIMAELGEDHEGVAVASKVADRVGVTRSVIVNALRKLESAGLIESRSLGMKGTYIKVLSPLFVEELGDATSPRVNY
jgi:transcriptional pleiotropic repressor